MVNIDLNRLAQYLNLKSYNYWGSDNNVEFVEKRINSISINKNKNLIIRFDCDINILELGKLLALILEFIENELKSEFFNDISIKFE